MFVSDQLVFIELHKTGCTHIRHLLRELLGGEFAGKHNQPGAELFTGDRVFLGSVRNPWDWYVSLWAYGCDRKGFIQIRTTHDALRLRGLGWRDDPRQALREFLVQRPSRHAPEWRRSYRDAGDPGGFRQWLHMVHDSACWPDLGEGYARSSVSHVAGLLSYRYLQLFTCRDDRHDRLDGIDSFAQLAEHDRKKCFIDHFIRNEQLESDLFLALQRAGFNVPQAKQAEILSRPRTNTSSHKLGPAHYYDADSEALVAARDKLIVDKFGYTAPRT